MSIRPKTSEYNIWVTMRQRCNNPKDQVYHRYGARGIKVCDRWSSFKLFLADMGPRPSKDHSLDRYPDMKGNYEPNNCRWATSTEQANNRSTNRHIELNGRRVTIMQAERITGVHHHTIIYRLNAGKSPEEAVSLAHKAGEHA